MADEEVVALVVDYGSGLCLLVFLVMHLALCSDVAGPFFLLLSSTVVSVRGPVVPESPGVYS